MPAPIDITLSAERLDDGSLGHTVAIGGGVSMLANDQASAHVMAIRMAFLCRIYTGEVTRIVEARLGGRR